MFVLATFAEYLLELCWRILAVHTVVNIGLPRQTGIFGAEVDSLAEQLPILLSGVSYFDRSSIILFDTQYSILRACPSAIFRGSAEFSPQTQLQTIESSISLHISALFYSLKV